MADMEALKKEHPQEWKIFDTLDVDNGGTLDKDELWCKLAANGEETATQMLEMVDLNGDGVVDFDGECTYNELQRFCGSRFRCCPLLLLGPPVLNKPVS